MWYIAVHGVAKSQTLLSNNTHTNTTVFNAKRHR